MTYSVVVPVAFYHESNVSMTDAFLSRLAEELGVGRITVYHNGGPLANDGVVMLSSHTEVEIINATGWPFYKMWNQGILTAPSEVVVVLNNDLSWPQGEVEELAMPLTHNEVPDDVVAMCPDLKRTIPFDEWRLGDNRARHGLTGWAFAIRSDIFSKVNLIDERYNIWYGDRELADNIRRAGLHIGVVGGLHFEHAESSTSKYVPGIDDLREADRKLFWAKWGDHA